MFILHSISKSSIMETKHQIKIYLNKKAFHLKPTSHFPIGPEARGPYIGDMQVNKFEHVGGSLNFEVQLNQFEHAQWDPCVGRESVVRDKGRSLSEQVLSLYIPQTNSQNSFGGW